MVTDLWVQGERVWEQEGSRRKDEVYLKKPKPLQKNGDTQVSCTKPMLFGI